MRPSTLVAVVVLVCAPPAAAAEPPARRAADAPAAQPARVTKVFAVADLVGEPDARRKGERLAALVRSYVRPYSWQGHGGDGAAEYYEIGSALVVTNTADVLREAGDLLEAFGRIQSGTVPAAEPLASDLRVALNLPPVAPAPRAANQVVVKLRNVAAADAAEALAKHFNGKGVELQIDADAKTNTVLLSAGPEVLRAAGDILTTLDRQPPRVMATTLIVRASGDFVRACGLEVGAKPGGAVWTLTAREMHMFNGLMRAAKERSECDVLSRPQVQVADNQTGFVQVVDGNGVGITLRVTPRVKPDGSVLLRAEAQVAEAGPAATTHAVQTTAELKPGETLVARVGGALVIVTPTVLK